VGIELSVLHLALCAYANGSAALSRREEIEEGQDRRELSLRRHDGTNGRLHKAARGRTFAAAGSTKMMDIPGSSWPFLRRRRSY